MAAETAAIVAAGQPKKKAASPPKKRKADKVDSATDTSDTGPAATEMASDVPEASMVKKAAFPRKKRKTAAEPDAEAGAPPKKVKKETSKTAKPRQTKRTKKPVEEPPPSPAPSPVEVTPLVQAKIDAVKQFIGTEMIHEDSMLERGAHDSKLVSIPEWDLLGVIITLYFHYQLGSAEHDASISDLDEAITNRFKAPLLLAGDIDWVTINLATPTKLEQRIKEKIAYHGLEDVSLLEVEMELHARRNRAQHRLYRWEAEKVVQTGDFLRQLVEVGWDKMNRKIEADMVREDGREEGKVGVCPKSAVEVA